VKANGEAFNEVLLNHRREFTFTNSDVSHLHTLVSQLIDIALSEAKREVVYSRLARCLRRLGLASFGDYCTLLQDGDADERVRLVNAITTNLTAFFREAHHFDYLGTSLLPSPLSGSMSVRKACTCSQKMDQRAHIYSYALQHRAVFVL